MHPGGGRHVYLGRRVVRELTDLIAERGRPKMIVSAPQTRCSPGPVMSASSGTTSLRGKPTQNGFVESFNGRMRDELLNQTLFFAIGQARREHLRRRTRCSWHNRQGRPGRSPIDKLNLQRMQARTSLRWLRGEYDAAGPAAADVVPSAELTFDFGNHATSEAGVGNDAPLCRCRPVNQPAMLTPFEGDRRANLTP